MEMKMDGYYLKELQDRERKIAQRAHVHGWRHEAIPYFVREKPENDNETYKLQQKTVVSLKARNMNK
jgi:hypothetical protein